MEDPEATRARLARLAWLLDSALPIPGLPLRFGLDAVLGLIPGFGDAAGVLLSAYIVREAARLGVPRATLWRMTLNVAIEGILGAVPLLGDLFDVAWQANRRNVALLDVWLADPRRMVRDNRRFVWLIIAVVVLLAVAGAACTYLIIHALIQLFR